MNTPVGGAVEQRRQPRLKLVCPVRLYRESDALELSTATENICSGGFYCISPVPFAPGERLQCDIVLPIRNDSGSGRKLILRCGIEVVHAAASGGGTGFGLGCRLVNYEVQFQ